MTTPDPPDYSTPPAEALGQALERGYVGVRIEQGAPVLDRDLTLLGELALATFRAVAARYIGDGVAAGSDAFAIGPAEDDNDVEILAGPRPPGVFLAGGLEASISEPLRYRDQEGVPELTSPASPQPDPREDTVYLDVWLAEEEGAGDGTLLNPDDFGMRTSTRTAPAWRVRVAEGGEPPEPEPGHRHHPLAQLQRPRGESRITADQIRDLRRTRLNLVDVEERVEVLERLPGRLLGDLFDVEPAAYERDAGRPQVSVRATLNALLSGGVPGTPPRPLMAVSADSSDESGRVARGEDGTVLSAWSRKVPHEEQPGNRVEAAMVKRLDRDGEEAKQLRTASWSDDVAGVSAVSALPLADGRALVSYRHWFSDGIIPHAQAHFRLAPLGDLEDAPEHLIASTVGGHIFNLDAVMTGDLVTFLLIQQGTWSQLQAAYRRLRLTDEGHAWIDGGTQPFGPAQAWPLAAVSDRRGRVWVGFQTTQGVRVRRIEPETALADRDQTLSGAAAPVLHRGASGVPWLFFHDEEEGPGLHGAFFDGAEWQRTDPPPAAGAKPNQAIAFEGPDGGLWVCWTHEAEDAADEIRAARRDPDTGLWSPPRRLSLPRASCSHPAALGLRGGSTLLLSRLERDTDPAALHEQTILTAF